MKPDLKMFAIVHEKAIKGMGGNRGKMTSQTGHAFLHAFWDAEKSNPELAEAYKNSGAAKKITLICDDEALMRQLVEDYRGKTGVTVVEDAGLTVFKGQRTFTCIGIGPLDANHQDERLNSMKIFL